MAEWTPAVVADWLEATVGLRAQFLAEGVSGAAPLEGVSDQELQDALQIHKIGHRKQLQRGLRALQQTSE